MNDPTQSPRAFAASWFVWIEGEHRVVHGGAWTALRGFALGALGMGDRARSVMPPTYDDLRVADVMSWLASGLFERRLDELPANEVGHLCMYICMHICMHACMHACMHVCRHAYLHACMHACMHACVHLRRLESSWLTKSSRLMTRVGLLSSLPPRFVRRPASILPGPGVPLTQCTPLTPPA